MKKTLQLLLVGMLILPEIRAQSLVQMVVANEGGIAHSTQMSLSWTFGETFVASTRQSKIWLTEGFQQPLPMSVIIPPAFTNNEVTGPDIQLAPNPVASLLHLNIGETREERLLLKLYNQEGKSLLQQSLIAPFNHATVNFSEFPSGLYYLRILAENGDFIQTFKVIKQ